VRDLIDPKLGVVVKDRKYHLQTYNSCFIGSELTTWIQNWLKEHNLEATKEAAVEVAKKLHAARIFAHVVDPHPFKDDFLFYRFQISE
jgi:potassium efflux system protein